MGDASSPEGWQFRGQRVVQAVLNDLVASRGLGRQTPGQKKGKTTIIYGGSSAGGRGAMVHLDYIKPMLGTVGSNVLVYGLLDSPYWIDVPPFPIPNSTFIGFANITKDVYKQANVTHLDPGCAAAYPGEESWKCLFGEYRMPFLKTPYLLVASQDDAFQLGYDLGSFEPTSDQERTYAANFAAQTRRVG